MRDGFLANPEDSSAPEFPDVPVGRTSRGGSWSSFIPVLGMAVCTYLLASAKDDLSYLFASSTPIDLGEPGAYHLDRARAGIFARITGEVHSEGQSFHEGQVNGKVWPIATAPVLVERRGDAPLRGRVTVEGRLQSDEQLPAAYHHVIALFLGIDELGYPGAKGHVWLVVEGRVPRALDRTNAWLVGLMLLFLANAWLVIKPIVRR